MEEANEEQDLAILDKVYEYIENVHKHDGSAINHEAIMFSIEDV